MTIKDKAAIVGVGARPHWKRGQSWPETELSMACTAILGALDDAGLAIKDLDGFSIYSSSRDPRGRVDARRPRGPLGDHHDVGRRRLRRCARCRCCGDRRPAWPTAASRS